jgi:hypothetical protein
VFCGDPTGKAEEALASPAGRCASAEINSGVLQIISNGVSYFSSIYTLLRHTSHPRKGKKTAFSFVLDGDSLEKADNKWFVKVLRIVKSNECSAVFLPDIGGYFYGACVQIYFY